MGSTPPELPRAFPEPADSSSVLQADSDSEAAAAQVVTICSELVASDITAEDSILSRQLCQ